MNVSSVLSTGSLASDPEGDEIVRPYHEIRQPDAAPRKHPVVLADTLLPPPDRITRYVLDVVIKASQHIPMRRVLEVLSLLLVDCLVQRHLQIR